MICWPSFCASRPRSASDTARTAAETASRSIAFGLPMAQFLVPELPFGGVGEVGESGLGSYHGRHSVVTVSHRRSVVAAQS